MKIALLIMACTIGFIQNGSIPLMLTGTSVVGGSITPPSPPTLPQLPCNVESLPPIGCDLEGLYPYCQESMHDAGPGNSHRVVSDIYDEPECTGAFCPGPYPGVWYTSLGCSTGSWFFSLIKVNSQSNCLMAIK